MKKDEVPQDKLDYYGEQRKAVYALDQTGHYTTVPSSGWQVEATVTGDAADEYRRLAAEARARVEAGTASTLEFHMYDRRMDVPMLAETVRSWQWRVRRHLQVDHFAQLPEAWVQRYAEALGLTVDALRRLP
ncbi:MAG TPA: hypothetical protein VM074_02660 [Solimonas sp.]|nr:hypothetical protein [Solimonas sp.]